MPRYLRIKNWDQFQHYKDRNPPWIKLHRSLLDDYEFSALPDASKGQLMFIWLFASQNEGKIPHDAKFLERKLGFTDPCDLNALISAGFLIEEQSDSGGASACASTGASNAIASRKQDASDPIAPCKPSRARESQSQRTKATETESAREAFSRFWGLHPRKVGKKDAEHAWRKIPPAEHEAIFAGLHRAIGSVDWARDDGAFIPHPATWLNGRRWEDEYRPANPASPELPDADYDPLATAQQRMFVRAA